MPVTWTDDQLDAIEAVDGPVLVSAAAGSGKTAVLTERAVGRILDPNDPTTADSLLVVTFTNAAAAEMRSRIEDKLREAVFKNSEDFELRRQLAVIQNADICTLHKFCGKLARENFAALGISPDFRIVETVQAQALQDEAVSAVLDHIYNDRSSFSALLEAFEMAQKDNAVEKVILDLHEFLSSAPFAEEWMNRVRQKYCRTDNLLSTSWGKLALKKAGDLALMINEYAVYNLNDLESGEGFSENACAIIASDLGFASRLLQELQNGSWDEIKAAAEGLDTKSKLVLKTKKTDPKLAAQIGARRSRLKELVTEIKSILFAGEQEILRDIAASKEVIDQLLKAAELFALEYKNRKAEKNVAEFNDLEHWALELLVKRTGGGIEFTELARTISEGYTEVMVDEYQDANEIQELIYRALSNDGEKLFTVGDVKQCIYKFRKAHPEIFMRRRESYERYDRKKKNYPAKIILKKNFRSKSSVLDAVNFVFRNLMSKSAAGMDYLEEDYLQYGGNYLDESSCDVTYTLIDKTGTMKRDEAEARHIGIKILSMLKNEMVEEKGTSRPARFSDFAILMSSVKSSGGIYIDVFQNMGIPVVITKTEDEMIKSKEVDTIMSVLRIIDNPMQDLPLAAAMMSPIFGFTPDEMVEIRAGRKGKSLYAAVLESAEAGMEKAERFLQELNEMRLDAITLPVDTLIRNIYVKTGYMSVVLAMPNPKRRVSNLKLLQEYAKAYEETGGGVCAFVSYIDNLVMQGRDLAANPNLDGEDDVVRIMTIHGSKGLEFPFCFVAGLSKVMQRANAKGGIMMDEDADIGIIIKDRGANTAYQSLPYASILEKKQEGEAAEKLRVLYVAMTRARQKLVMVAANSKGVQSEIKNSLPLVDVRQEGEGFEKSQLNPYYIMKSSSMSYWITACAVLNPGGGRLRELASDFDFHIQADARPWNVEILGEPEEVDAAAAKAMLRSENDIDTERLKRQIGSVYKNEKMTRVPQKVSVSQLVHDDDYMEYAAASRPAFMSASKMTGAEKGTAAHSFMQFADFKSALEDFDAELSRLLKHEYLTDTQAASVDGEKVQKCLGSGIMRRFLESGKQYREFRFTTKIRLEESSLLTEAVGEEIILQGAVDCAFEEDGEVVIIDYKTDRTKDLNSLREKYKDQLMYYKKAMAEITGLPVKECYIYSFFLDDYIRVE